MGVDRKRAAHGQIDAFDPMEASPAPRYLRRNVAPRYRRPRRAITRCDAMLLASVL
jgi:hypothetical protein